MSTTYKLSKKQHLPGSWLLVEMPDLTTERVEELFGPKKLNAQDKYSDIIVVIGSDGNRFSLYMCYGVWRIGAEGPTQPDATDFINYLMERG